MSIKFWVFFAIGINFLKQKITWYRLTVVYFLKIQRIAGTSNSRSGVNWGGNGGETAVPTPIIPTFQTANCIFTSIEGIVLRAVWLFTAILLIS